jgi:ABC-type phosphate transport system permease subunit
VPRTDDSTAYAANWRTVLAVDAGLGVLVALVGVVLALSVSAVVGVALGVLGAAYAALIGVRARRWSRLRRSASH